MGPITPLITIVGGPPCMSVYKHDMFPSTADQRLQYVTKLLVAWKSKSTPPNAVFLQKKAGLINEY